MPRVWKISPGERASQWEMCRQRRCIVLGWRALRNYRQFGNNNRAIVRALGGGFGNGSGAATSILRFAYDVKPPDIVVANRGRSGVVGIGLVNSDYLASASSKNPSLSDEFPHARGVDWIIDRPIDLGRTFFAASTVTLLKPDQVNRIRHAYAIRYPKLQQALDNLFNSALIDDRGSIDTENILETVEEQLDEEGAFDPENVRDARTRTLSLIVQRQGQSAFRKRLLAAYGGRCAISGCGIEELLEAAHIAPYKGQETNRLDNGILLRADLHTLFDLHLIAIDESAMRVLVSEKLNASEYEKYRNQEIRTPKQSSRRPSKDALRFHRRFYESKYS